VHESAELRQADNAIIGFDFQQAHGRAHGLLEKRRRDRDVLQFNGFDLGNLQGRSPLPMIDPAYRITAVVHLLGVFCESSASTAPARHIYLNDLTSARTPWSSNAQASRSAAEIRKQLAKADSSPTALDKRSGLRRE
jgi:hypothetical protein